MVGEGGLPNQLRDFWRMEAPLREGLHSCHSVGGVV